MIFERRPNACKTNKTNNRNIKKLEKPKPNKYIQKDFHKIRSKIDQY